jgi:hypothetical protein
MGDRKNSDVQTHRQEASWLQQLAQDVVDVYPTLPEIERQLAKTGETTKNIKTRRCGPLSCDLRVVRYGPGETHLQAICTRSSVREWEGIRQAGVRGDLRQAKRRVAVRRRHTKTCILVWNRPFNLPPEVDTRLRARGGAPDAFHGEMLRALRGRHHGTQRGVTMPPSATVPEAQLTMGIPLVQSGIIADAAVHYLLVRTMGVSGEAVKRIWKRLVQGYQEPQHPYSLSSYLKRLVADVAPSQWEQVLHEPISGEEYLTVRQVVKELTEAAEVFRGAAKAGRLKRVQVTSIKADESTVYRWIKENLLPANMLPYQTRFGIRKQVRVVTRANFQRLKETRILDETAVATLQTARKISRASAERAYRRLCQPLGITVKTPLKSDKERKAIQAALLADAKVCTWRERWKDRVAGANAQKRSETTSQAMLSAELGDGHRHHDTLDEEDSWC